MKNILLFYFLFAQFQGFSQLENTTLWKISGNSLTEPSYIFGTIHQICSTNELVKPKLKEVIETSKNVFLEIKFDTESNDFESHYDAYLKNGKTFRSYYTNGQYGVLEQLFNKQMASKGLKLSYFTNFKPSEVLGYLIPLSFDCPKWTSYEAEISKLAKKNKVRVLGLESYEEHNSFESETDSTIKANAEKLFDLITNPDTKKDYIGEFTKLKGLYLDGKIDELYKEVTGEKTIRENELLLDFRNKLWIPRISKYSQKGQMLYAFGAAHLAGENGVINLLRKAGFTVTPVFE